MSKMPHGPSSRLRSLAPTQADSAGMGIWLDESPGATVVDTVVRGDKGTYGVSIQASPGRVLQGSLVYGAEPTNVAVDGGLVAPSPPLVVIVAPKRTKTCAAATADVDCFDGDPCTKESCVALGDGEQAGCEHAPIAGCVPK
jgi:hypothetical protein